LHIFPVANSPAPNSNEVASFRNRSSSSVAALVSGKLEVDIRGAIRLHSKNEILKLTKM
jgi:hypothetical protein